MEEQAASGFTLSGINWWLPIDISVHGKGIDDLILMVHIFMLLLFVGWGAYLLYCLVKFKESNVHKADLTVKHFNLPKYLEVGIIIFEIVVLVAFSLPVWKTFRYEFPAEKDAVVVRLVAEQFSWSIHYPGQDRLFGRTDASLMDASNPVGVDRQDPNGKDDIVSINSFNVPVNKPIIVRISSKDVIHSINIPVMRVKQDAVPGMENKIWFQATQTGEHDLACAQLCGSGHYRMKAIFNVQSEQDFQNWLLEEYKTIMEEAGGGEQNAAASAVPALPSTSETTEGRSS